MRVLNVGQNYYISGGSDRYLFSLAQLLENKGHCVIPFSANNTKNVASIYDRYFPTSANFEQPKFIDAFRYIYSFPARSHISKLLKYEDVDIAHLHIYYGKITSSVLAPLQRHGIPIVQTLHEYKLICAVHSLYSNGHICEDCEGTKYYRSIVNRCNRGSLVRSGLSAIESYVSRWLGGVDKVDHFIAVSNFLRDKVVEYGIPPEKVTVVHNFIDCQGIEPSPSPGGYFLYFGRIERNKGIFTLLRAMQLSGLAIPLFMAGEGRALNEAKAIVEKEGISNVHFVGFKSGDQLAQLIRGAICTVAPSELYETFGLTLIESFAHGRPVVASRIGGMTEVVSDGQDGFLFEPGNAEELADHMLWFSKHPTEAVEMGMSGRKKIESKFSPEEHYQALMNVYEKVLS